MLRGPNFQEPALVHSSGIFIYLISGRITQELLSKKKNECFFLFAFRWKSHGVLAYCVCVQDRWAEPFAKGAKVRGPNLDADGSREEGKVPGSG